MRSSAAFLTCMVAAATAVPAPESGLPAEIVAKGKSFRLQQTRNERFKARDAVHEFYMAHSKYGKTIPAALKATIQQRPRPNTKFSIYGDGTVSKGSVTASPVQPAYDSEYIIPVQVGTPPQTLPMNLDTGSADFWVFSTTTYAMEVQHQKLYSPNASLTSQVMPGESWKVLYGDGSGASGIVYKDKVSVAGLEVATQAVQVAVDVSPDISKDSASSGILGMASGRANTVRPHIQLTFLDNIMEKLQQPVFTANLQKGAPGSYDFGYIDHRAYTGEIKYAQISLGSPFWQVYLTGYAVGDLQNYNSTRFPAIVDTGTSLLMLPEDLVKSYYAKVPDSYFDPKIEMMMIPCNATLPDLTFGIDEYRGRIPGHFMNYAQNEDGHCYGGLQSSEGLPFGVIGDILIKSQYIVFNRGDLTVGFANKQTPLV